MILRLSAITLGLLQAWAYRYVVYMEDAWSYLDIADKYLRGDFANALSSYWSPLYSWLIALSLIVFHPPVCEKFVVLKVINFASFLFVIFAFELLLDQVKAWYSEDLATGGRPLLKVNSGQLELWSYIVFIFMSLSVGAVRKDTPDLLMSGFLYAATALTLAFWRGHSDGLKPFLLGFSLGIGYLCKAVMFPLAFVYLFILALAPQPKLSKLKTILSVVAAFILVASPYIAAISIKNHRLLFSTTMQYNYALLVLRNAPFRHALALRNADQLPMKFTHPSQVIFDHPQVFYFAEPIHATFATHYDPAYWFDGIKIYFDGVRQIVATLLSTSLLVRLFFGWLFLGWLVLLFGCRSRAITLKSMAWRLPLFLPSLAGLTLYSIGINCCTLYSERYFPGFFVLWFLGLMGSISLPDSGRVRKVLLISSIVSLLGMGVRFALELGDTIEALKTSAVNENCLILKRLTEVGITPGDQLANMDLLRSVGWAQMGQFRIVADIIDDGAFWQITEAERKRLYDVLRQRHIKLLTYANGDNPPKQYPRGWQQVAGTKFWFYLL
ncbi:MAG: hypothetical protein Q8T09_22115 [Candidatus Melainabacteria bacterium]|nr:hypothetical protein [Candidatus Melainabacteria bacterium]